MSLLDSVEKASGATTTSFNTGTLYDFENGRYVQGLDGKFYLNGGLAQHMNAVVGPNGAFKSTFSCGMVMRSAAIYNDSEVVIVDTETSLDRDKPRACRMAEELYTDDLQQRVTWFSGNDYTLDEFFKILVELCEQKKAKAKDYQVESPFLDLSTGKALKIWKPTYIFIDSYTEFMTDAEKEMLFGDKSKTLSDANTAYMLDGNKKTMFVRLLKNLCVEYGLVAVLTGHFDKVMQVDKYNPTPKDTTFSKTDWKTKGVGRKFQFLASVYARTATAPLLDANKEPLYGIGRGPLRDVMEVDVVVERTKTACAGETLPFVATQSFGIMNAVTNYHYLRCHDFYGLDGSKQKQTCKLVPEVALSRNTIRELTKSDAKLRRALELAAQYCFIKNNWYTDDYPVDFSRDVKELFDVLISDKNKNVVDDVLNSRGYWTYTKTEQPYMSLFDVMWLAGFKK